MPQIIPMQPVRHLPRAIAFYEKLGFTLEDRRDDWGWAKLCWGDCQVMLDQSINVNPDAPRGAVLYCIPTTSASSMRRRGRTGWTCPNWRPPSTACASSGSTIRMATGCG